ncbi:hypothetical protein Tco_1055314 [Tanacetum coccineum]|uniref:Uncharacterized protein n=1 Tax=Tanacetum coccineum TaxID=301880 RepID=A0ABQ5GZ96_9ASTR
MRKTHTTHEFGTWSSVVRLSRSGDIIYMELSEAVFTDHEEFCKAHFRSIRVNIRHRRWLELLRSGYHQKDRKPSQNDKTEHGMEKDCAKSRPKSKNAKVKVKFRRISSQTGAGTEEYYWMQS